MFEGERVSRAWIPDNVSGRKKAIVFLELLQDLFGMSRIAVQGNFYYHNKKLSSTKDVIDFINKKMDQKNKKELERKLLS